jgi:hypothetical protein
MIVMCHSQHSASTENAGQEGLCATPTNTHAKQGRNELSQKKGAVRL